MQLSSGKQIWATAWQKQQNYVRQRRLRSAWTSAQSDQSLHCIEKHWILSYPVSVQLIWVFARSHAGHFSGFVMLWFIYIFQF